MVPKEVPARRDRTARMGLSANLALLGVSILIVRGGPFRQLCVAVRNGCSIPAIYYESIRFQSIYRIWPPMIHGVAGLFESPARFTGAPSVCKRAIGVAFSRAGPAISRAMSATLTKATNPHRDISGLHHEIVVTDHVAFGVTYRSLRLHASAGVRV